MLTQRPNPFLLGIVIGAMLHLLVMPWLTQTHANAQTGQAPTDSVLGIEIDGIRYAVRTHEEALSLRRHLEIGVQVFGRPTTSPGSLISPLRAISGIPAGDDMSETVYSGDVLAIDFHVDGEAVRTDIVVLGALDMDPLAETSGLTESEIEDLRDEELNTRIIWSLIENASGEYVPIALYSVHGAEVDVVLPLSVVSQDAAALIASAAVDELVDLLLIDESYANHMLAQFEALGLPIPATGYEVPGGSFEQEISADGPPQAVHADDGRDENTTRQARKPRAVLFHQCVITSDPTQQERNQYNLWVNQALMDYDRCVAFALTRAGVCGLPALLIKRLIEGVRTACRFGLPACLAALTVGISLGVYLWNCLDCLHSRLAQCRNWMIQNLQYLCNQINSGQAPQGLQNASTTPGC